MGLTWMWFEQQFATSGSRSSDDLFGIHLQHWLHLFESNEHTQGARWKYLMISSSPPIRPPWSAADSSGFSLSWSSVLPSSSSQSATWDLGALVGTLRWAYVRWMGICEVVNKDIVGTEQGTTQVTSCRNPTGLASGAVIYLVGVTIPFLVLLLSHLALEVFFILKKVRTLSLRNWIGAFGWVLWCECTPIWTIPLYS